VQAARARAVDVLARAPLHDRDVDLRQRELGRQHQPGRTSTGDHHRMLGHRRPPAGITPVAQSGGAHTRTSAPSARNRTASPTIGSASPRNMYVDNNTRIS
jgi:hypothetical protein